MANTCRLLACYYLLAVCLFFGINSSHQELLGFACFPLKICPVCVLSLFLKRSLNCRDYLQPGANFDATFLAHTGNVKWRPRSTCSKVLGSPDTRKALVFLPGAQAETNSLFQNFFFPVFLSYGNFALEISYSLFHSWPKDNWSRI